MYLFSRKILIQVFNGFLDVVMRTSICKSIIMEMKSHFCDFLNFSNNRILDSIRFRIHLRHFHFNSANWRNNRQKEVLLPQDFSDGALIFLYREVDFKSVHFECRTVRF